MPRTIIQEIRAALANANPVQLSFCEDGARPGVIALTDAITSGCAALSDAIADAYFQHAVRRRADVSVVFIALAVAQLGFASAAARSCAARGAMASI